MLCCPRFAAYAPLNGEPASLSCTAALGCSPDAQTIPHFSFSFTALRSLRACSRERFLGVAWQRVAAAARAREQAEQAEREESDGLGSCLSRAAGAAPRVARGDGPPQQAPPPQRGPLPRRHAVRVLFETRKGPAHAGDGEGVEEAEEERQTGRRERAG